MLPRRANSGEQQPTSDNSCNAKMHGNWRAFLHSSRCANALKIPFPQGRAGSIPAPGTNEISQLGGGSIPAPRHYWIERLTTFMRTPGDGEPQRAMGAPTRE